MSSKATEAQGAVKPINRVWVIALAIMLLAAAGCALTLSPTFNGSRAHAETTLAAGAPATKTYPIVYHLNGGTQSKSQILEITAKETLDVGKLKKPTRTGCKFLGWFTDAALTKEATSIQGAANAKKRTLYAKWERRAYPIVYKLNGGENRAKQKKLIAVGSSINVGKLKKPTRTGYSFVGWYKNKKLTNSATEIVGKAAKSKRTLYAKWKIKTYKLSYKLNGGEMSSNHATTYNVSKTTKLPLPVKPGYSFEGWCTNKKLTNNVGRSTEDFVGNKTLYAKWTPIVYSIAYILDGGTLPSNAPTTYSIESPVKTLPTPTKTGYSFMGWFSDAKKTNIVTSIPSTSKGNKKLYALWQKRTLVAHRGLRANTVENSVQAFQNAADKGFSEVELDVQFTADGAPVIVHNPTVKISSSTGNGASTASLVEVASLSYEQLQTATFAQAVSGTDDKNLATFEEAMEACKARKLNVIIHMKSTELPQVETLFSIVQNYGMLEKVSWLSNDLTALRYLRAEDPDASVMYLHAPTKQAVSDAAEFAKGGKVAISCKYTLATKTRVDYCKKVAIPLSVWTLEDETKIKGLDPYISQVLIDDLKASKVPSLIEL